MNRRKNTKKVNLRIVSLGFTAFSSQILFHFVFEGGLYAEEAETQQQLFRVADLTTAVNDRRR